MRLLRSSLRSALLPIVIGAQAIVLISCDAAQPVLVQRPTFSPSSEPSADVYDNGTRSIRLSVPDSSLAPGQSVQATAIPYNGQGAPTGTVVTWRASSSLVTVSSSGLITAGQSAGSVTVSATSGTYTKNMAITVGSSGPLAAQLTLSVNPTSVKIGQTAQVSGLVGYSTPPTTPAQISFTSQQPNIASVSSSGLLKGLAVGTVTILAQVDTIKRTISVAVLDSASGSTPVSQPPTSTTPVPGGATGGSYGNATAAELPRLSVSTSYPSMARQVRVPAGASLQSAINAAQPGDELLLAPGATYTGNFFLPNKGSSSSWIVIRTDASDAQIGNPGTRMTPTRARSANLARILTNTISSAIVTNLGASHYRITGVELGATSAVTNINAIVRFGEGSGYQNTVASIANNLILDRVWVHGSSTMHMNRCLLLNSATSAVVDSWLADCHSNNGESQAIVGWNGPGPYLIQNNHLEAGHEVVVFGGSTATITNQSPSDITLRGNHITRPTSWKGVWQVKNLLETKHVKRLLIEGNVFENNWVDAQAGFAILFKSENQNNDNPWTTSSDITVRYNKIRNTGNGFNLAANPSGMPAIPAQRIVITDNVLENIGQGIFTGSGHSLQLLGDLRDVVMRHNTITSAGAGGGFAVMLGSLPQVQRFVLHSNIMTRGGFGIKGGGTTEGTASLNYFAPGYTVSNNVIVGSGVQGPYPANTWFTSSFGNVGFANFSGGDFHLSGSSPYLGKGYDGREVGADIDQVNAQTSGAVVAP
jgi:hypothetical protein